MPDKEANVGIYIYYMADIAVYTLCTEDTVTYIYMIVYTYMTTT